MKLWIARGPDKTLHLYKNEPIMFFEEYMGEYWAGSELCKLPVNDFPEVTLENSPKEVELKLINQ